MITPWWAWALTVGTSVVLGVGLYFLAWRRGYIAGRADRINDLPVNPPWIPPSETEFMAELLGAERRQDKPQKYRREP